MTQNRHLRSLGPDRMKWRHEIAVELEHVVATNWRIAGAAYFGSGATGEVDRFSDIDLVVGCTGADADDFLLQLHAALTFVLFRPFSEDRKRGGRYWFAGTNPFVRLDVSFYEPSELDDLLRNGRGYAQPPFRRISAGATAA